NDSFAARARPEQPRRRAPGGDQRTTGHSVQAVDERRREGLHAALRHVGGFSLLPSRDRSPANATRSDTAAQIAGQSRTITTACPPSGSCRKLVALMFDFTRHHRISAAAENPAGSHQRMNTSAAFFGKADLLLIVLACIFSCPRHADTRDDCDRKYQQ